jgi:two-component system, probable response regulator PhcQ
MSTAVALDPESNSNPRAEAAPKKSILIVDDEENVRNALRRALRKEGYALYFAEGPAVALELLKTNRVDLIISDHMMPQMSGIDFLTLVRDRYPDIMRLMITGHADLETAIKAINHGEIHRFLTKPWDDVELKVTLFLAFERQDLERENRDLVAQVRRQQMFIGAAEKEHPGLMQVLRDKSGAILLDDDELATLQTQSA